MITASSARASSSSFSISRRSTGSIASRSSRRSSSMCCSRSIVVSLTFVKDDAHGHGCMAGSGIAERDRQRRRVGVPILSECREPERRQNWGHRSSLKPSCPHDTLGRTEQTFPQVWHQRSASGLDARLQIHHADPRRCLKVLGSCGKMGKIVDLDAVRR
ncbi:conserved hypothetical protein (plasmid) [Rhizobium johnstonii 3841]|uniref:Uncharacterized protein n=1 Tax=Rhizobium johnstonii (strain DSM 114642 / LMG 32736 / 3841) TaxID=216596 RepID=Q1M9Z6_RHIJ3|nr:conserved hypothetical protein [Rhizobium johnstonii 3841]